MVSEEKPPRRDTQTRRVRYVHPDPIGYFGTNINGWQKDKTGNPWSENSRKTVLHDMSPTSQEHKYSSRSTHRPSHECGIERILNRRRRRRRTVSALLTLIFRVLRSSATIFLKGETVVRKRWWEKQSTLQSALPGNVWITVQYPGWTTQQEKKGEEATSTGINFQKN